MVETGMQNEKEISGNTVKNTAGRKELEACDFIKTVLMVIVVVYHSVLFWTGTWFTKDPAFEAAPLEWMALWMNSFHIYGFTLVSGYIFYHVKCRLGRYKDYKSFLVNKANRLLVPYVFVAVLWVIPFQRFFMKISAVDMIKNYALGISPSQLWFLLMLFGVFAIMWPLSGFIHRHVIADGVVIVVMYLAGMVGQSIFPNLFQIWTVFKYCLYFWLGMKLCQHADTYGISVLKRVPVWLWITMDFILYLVTRKIPEGGILLAVLGVFLNLLLSVVGALMAFFVLSKLSGIIPWKKNKAISVMSKFSFPIYLFHQQLVFYAIYLLNGKVSPYVNAAANIFIAFAGALLISWVLTKCKVTRVLIGEKT